MILKNKQGFDIIIDDEDFIKSNRGKSLHVKTNKFVILSKRINGKGTHVYLHKLLVGAGKETQVDHINGNRLDNRKSNLRVCSHQQNQWNKAPRNYDTIRSKSIFKGVSFRNGKFYARISTKINDTRIQKLATFKSEKEAANQYDAWAKELFGEFAYLNSMII